VNPEDKFTLVFNRVLESLFVERMEQNEDIFAKFMNDDVFQKTVAAWMAREVYKRLQKAAEETTASSGASPDVGHRKC
jgi:type I restriction enzyme R subunit